MTSLNARASGNRRVACRPRRGAARSRSIRSREADGSSTAGSRSPGGLLAGLDLARVCLGDLADVSILSGEVAGRPVPLDPGRRPTTPSHACLASQYAGWAITEGKYFAMGSGPMRAIRRKEPIFDAIGFHEEADAVVGVLETRKAPTAGRRRQDRRRVRAWLLQPSRCWPRRRPAWREACRSWRGRSRRPSTSWLS